MSPVVVLVLVLGGCGDDDLEPEGGGVAPEDPSEDQLEGGEPVITAAGDLGFVVGNATLGFLGTVLDSSSSRDERGLIVTTTEFAVEDILLGTGSDMVAVTQLGGELDGQAMVVSHLPTFELDWRYVVFVDEEITTLDPIVANEHGVFIVADQLVYTSAGIGVQDVVDGQLVYAPVFLEELFPNDRDGRSLEVDPSVEGEVIEAAPLEAADDSILTVDAFAEFVRALAGG